MVREQTVLAAQRHAFRLHHFLSMPSTMAQAGNEAGGDKYAGRCRRTVFNYLLPSMQGLAAVVDADAAT